MNEQLIKTAFLLVLLMLFVIIVFLARKKVQAEAYENRPFLQRGYSFNDWKRLFW